MQSEAIIFVDINFFLHYKQAKEIDWRSVADADVVRLMVMTETTSELNDKKDFGKTKAIKKRDALKFEVSALVMNCLKPNWAVLIFRSRQRLHRLIGMCPF
jgi:hypothetical protein